MKHLLFCTLLISSSIHSAAPAAALELEQKPIKVKTVDGQVREVPKGYFPTLDNCVDDLGVDDLGDDGIALANITADDLDGAVAIAEKRPGIITEGVLAALYYCGYPRALLAVYRAWLQKEENKKEPIHEGTEKELLQYMKLDPKQCSGDMYKDTVWALSAKELAEVEPDERKTCISKQVIRNKEKEVGFSGIDSLCCLHKCINPAIITKLVLSLSQLTEISPDSLNKLRALRELDLSYNQLTKIDAKSFVGLYQLQELNLNHNCIEYIDSEVFADLCFVLRALDLSSNKLTEIDAKSFFCLSFSLQKLDLSWNQLKKLDTNIFAYLLGLQKLFLWHNPLGYENIKKICRASLNTKVYSEIQHAIFITTHSTAMHFY